MKYFTLLTLAFLAFSLSDIKAQNNFTGKPQYQIATKRDGVFLGNINVELFPLIAPKHVRNFDSLVSTQFYDSTAFHRVIPGFMIQGGDPNSRSGPKSTWGYGDPSQPTVPAEFSAAPHIRGTLSAARGSDTNSATSQFFICVAAASWLNGQYSVYGKVTAGMNWVDTIVKEPRDANDNPYKKIEMFITYTGENTTVPVAPALVSPADSTRNVPVTQALKWNAVNDAVMYRLEVSTDSTFANYFVSRDVAALTYSLTNLSGYTTYYWRIRTNNGGYLSDYSETRVFTTGTGAAELVSPANTSTLSTVDADFSWKSVTGATSYRLQVAKASSFSSTSLVYDQAGITDTFQTVTGLTSNTLHYWRIRSANGSEEGFYSLKWTFKTGTTTSLNNVNDNITYKLGQNIPNPCSRYTTISYSLPATEKVSIRLYDILGRELKTLINEEKPRGEYQLNFDVSSLSSGLYFYTIRAGEYRESRKLVVER